MSIAKVLLAGLIIFVWVRSVINSFKPRESLITTYSLPTVEYSIEERAQTPRPTSWTISSVLEEENNNSEVISTPTPETTVTVAPVVTEWVKKGIITPTPTVWYEDIYIPNEPGIAKMPVGDPDESQIAKLSYYWPPYAYEKPEYEINCDMVDGVLECEQMASGEYVADYVGEALGCPAEYPFGTVFEIFGRFYTCRDRGGAIVRVDQDTIWVDILYPYMPNGAYWGQEVPVNIWYP